MASTGSTFLISVVAIFILQATSTTTNTTTTTTTTTSEFLHCMSQRLPPNNTIIFLSTNPSFSKVLTSYIRNLRLGTPSTPKPVLIITPTDVSHVQSTVLCAQTAPLLIKIRSGGHDYEGISYVSDHPFIILDMFNLRAVSVDLPSETAVVQTGATLGELYYNIAQKSGVHGYPAGICPTVGVGGHISGGGYGAMMRKYGLSVDNLVDAQIVDVQGRLLDRKAMGEDLFWAISGGSAGSFGVVVSYTLKLVPVPPIVTVFNIRKTLEENATALVYKWMNVADKTDEGLFIRLLLQPITSPSKKGEKTIRATFIAMFLGDSLSLVKVMNRDFPELGVQQKDCEEMSWLQSVLTWANFNSSTPPSVLLDRAGESVKYLKRKSDYLQEVIPVEGLELLWKKMMEIGKVGLVFNPYGGIMNRIKADATPFPHRVGNICKVQYSANWGADEGDAASPKYLGQIRSLYEYTTPLVSKNPRGAFVNYRDLDIGVGDGSFAAGSVYGRKYFLGNFERLVKVKTAVDPGNFFRNEQSVPLRA